MKAVHFGAGNIGRGFIGMILSRAGYEVTFIDVDAALIDELNEKQAYTVILADESEQKETVSNVKGINSMTDKAEAVAAVRDADIITTAVGASILPIISGVLAEGLSARVEAGTVPVNVIACENMIGGSQALKDHVLAKVDASLAKKISAQVGFPNAAVDRIVPNQTQAERLTVSVEPYFEWVVDQSMMVGDVPEIKGITYVPSLDPFIERKLFTVNTGHAVAAYLGYHFGYDTIKEAMDQEAVVTLVRGALKETGKVITAQYDFEEAEHNQYIEKILNRFMNPYISDEVTRVARGPLRKLGKNDRLVRPATLYYQLVNEEPTYLAKAIAAALLYDYTKDPEAEELQDKINQHGYEQALKEVSGLTDTSPLVEAVLKQLKILQG